jgi:hypothetical protein
MTTRVLAPEVKEVATVSTTRRLRVGALIAGCAVLSGMLLVRASAGQQADVLESKSDAAATLASIQPTLADREISAESVSAMPDGSSPSVTADEAATDARERFGMLQDAKLSAQLVSFTDSNLGPQKEDSGPITPEFSNSTAWMIGADNVKVPILAPADSVGPTEYSTTMIVFMDAETGKLDEAIA